MGNIAICCDGTSNEFSRHNTNVVKLYQMLVRDSPGKQIGFYIPGVGTFASRGALLPVSKRVTRWLGLITGFGLSTNIGDGYRFLMNNWQPGDEIYLFGFSRGAYTARAIAAVIHRCGILTKGHDNLIPYLYKVFTNTSSAGWKLAAQFKETFGRPVRIRFLGLWDTVSSVGWAWDPKSLPYTADNPSIDIVRHAVAIDERRAFFRQNLWKGEGDVKQVWFAGVHCDEGGSLSPEKSDLSQIALEWMVKESELAGLTFDQAKKINEFRTQPDYSIEYEDSLKGFWKLAEFYPKLHHTMIGPNQYKTDLRLNLFRPRRIPDDALVHESVAMRLSKLKNYRPSNLPEHYRIEPWLHASVPERTHIIIK